MQPVGHIISWEEFRNAFRTHHIPEGLIERKLNEFLALNQGTRTVLQYAQAFNHLCQYAGHHANIDSKKRDRFRRGLTTKLKERLNLVQPNTYNELVNLAITQEDCIAAHRAEKKAEGTNRTLECSATEVSSGVEHSTQASTEKCPNGQACL